MAQFRMRIILSPLCVVILIVVCITFHRRRPLFDAQVCLGLRKSPTDCLQCLGLPAQSYNYTVTPDERDFPLSYSILVYANPERAARLLAAIYRPHNFYCIHVDRKSSLGIVDLIKLYGQCFDSNVFFVPDEHRTTVRWGYFSVLQPEFTCTRLLLQRSGKWKYWINLTGQEFPLRTNLELVLALKALNGTNVVRATYKYRNMERIPPRSAKSQNIVWYKGQVHVAVRREFVDYMLNNDKAIRLLDELKEYESRERSEIIPDETFFATLNHNPDVFPIPGAVLHVNETETGSELIRYKVWNYGETPCYSGQAVRNICMLGTLDLPYLFQSPAFFANKFIPQVEPAAYAAMELWLALKCSHESLHHAPHATFDEHYYARKPIAWDHL
ncbi:beta-1 3-galactosyl-O-glycosyl-glycoprotein beta-1 6-N-acetylglucosaminyltransferase 4 [Clonorchis sinensis]|uniref:Beta-1 3-galactosyl-O-glycosyl-glycoprotein beta-1 6-N-acetylglucosaminyltransferase 4 n=1 Tax=Clonorchis sinensis TaxID=79923 RepID=G7YEX7_CLOSI|nr:beta-1 3-galactosyl-O-glycosyl-glycoprotein beta-1 6-N-acetylglucosaminyltransferase 4 [Clonorchis sinensis]